MLELRDPDRSTGHGDIELHNDLSEPFRQQHTPSAAALSFLEKKHLLLLGTLYFVHAIPLHFSWLTMPVILRQQLSYSDVATFLISQYPYSWKALWSPLVDGLYYPRIGRRKTWIVPSLVLGGAVLSWLASAQDPLVAEIANGRTFAMAWLVLAWFMVSVVCANIRIALDSWSISLLSPPNVHWGSSATNIGESSGAFIAYTLFLGVTSLKPPNKETGKADPASSHLFLGAVAVAFLITAVLLLAGKRENDKGEGSQSIRKVYNVIWEILKLRHVWILMLVHMASMVGFITNDTITTLQLVKNNFSDYDLAVLSAANIPFAIAGSYLVAKAMETRHPLYVWRKMFPYRLILAFVCQLTVLFCARYPDSHFRFLVVVFPYCLSSLLSLLMWVAFVAFHAQVSDPQYGGIYMSVLATTLNIRYDTLQFICTKAIGMIDGSDDLTKPSPLIDGYQVVNTITVVLAIPIYWFFLRPATVFLQTIDVSAWRVKHQGSVEEVMYEMVGTVEDDENNI